MTSEDRFGLRPLWDATLAIYAEIAKICERHGLRYYATDGTALGAVRHKGFIPWDDDLDISMPRPDYEKFRKIAEKELPSNLKFIDYSNTPAFSMLFGKVQETRRYYVEDVEKQVGHLLSGGIGVDVFPIEGYPSGMFRLAFVKLCHGILGRRVAFQGRKFWGNTVRGKVHFVCTVVCSVLTPWLKTPRDCLSALERVITSNRFDDCELTARTCSQRTIFRRKPLKKAVWGKPTPMEFDNTVVMVPEDCDAYLRNEFETGDYHELPPPGKQHPTHAYGYHASWWLGIPEA